MSHEELGGAAAHASRSGVAHFTAQDEDDCFRQVRRLLSFLPSNNADAPPERQVSGGVLASARSTNEVQGDIQSGTVWLPSRAHWLGEYLREITHFPTSKTDDQVDATAQALLRLRQSQAFFVATLA